MLRIGICGLDAPPPHPPRTHNLPHLNHKALLPTKAANSSPCHNKVMTTHLNYIFWRAIEQGFLNWIDSSGQIERRFFPPARSPKLHHCHILYTEPEQELITKNQKALCRENIWPQNQFGEPRSRERVKTSRDTIWDWYQQSTYSGLKLQKFKNAPTVNIQPLDVFLS